VPSPPQPVADLLAALARALGVLGVRWFLFGAQAAILHGAARLSADVDVTIDLGRRTVPDLIAALAGDFDVRVADPVRFAEETRVLPFVHRLSRMPLDVVLAGPGLEDQFFAGATERLIGAALVPVVGAEDLIAMKVLAGRPTDLEDVAAVARAHRDDLDLQKVRATLTVLETALDRRDLLGTLERIVAAVGRDASGDA
jgi:hypothetical protein